MAQPLTIPQPPSRKKKNTLLQTILALLLFCATFGSMYYYFVHLPSIEKKEQKKEVKQLQIKKVDWDAAIFQTSLFKSLANPLTGPLEVGTPGNKAPFSKKTPGAQAAE